MAAYDTQSDSSQTGQRASGNHAVPANRRRINEWLTALSCITVILIGIGFLVVCYGVLGDENYLALFVGLVIMDVGIIGWILVACYWVVTSIKRALAIGGEAKEPPLPQSQ